MLVLAGLLAGYGAWTLRRRSRPLRQRPLRQRPLAG